MLVILQFSKLKEMYISKNAFQSSFTISSLHKCRRGSRLYHIYHITHRLREQDYSPYSSHKKKIFHVAFLIPEENFCFLPYLEHNPKINSTQFQLFFSLLREFQENDQINRDEIENLLASIGKSWEEKFPVLDLYVVKLAI